MISSVRRKVALLSIQTENVFGLVKPYKKPNTQISEGLELKDYSAISKSKRTANCDYQEGIQSNDVQINCKEFSIFEEEEYLQITVSVNPCNQVEQIVRELYPESVCENIIWKQLEKKVARSFNGNWNRLKIEYLIPTYKLAMQLRKKIQGAQRTKDSSYNSQFSHPQHNHNRPKSGQYYQHKQTHPNKQSSPPRHTVPQLNPTYNNQTTVPQLNPTYNNQPRQISPPRHAPCQTQPSGWQQPPPPPDNNRCIEIPQSSFQRKRQFQPQYQQSWPLSTKSKVLVHLNEPEKKEIIEGDSYFYVAQSGYGAVNMVLRHVSKDGSLEEYPIDVDSDKDISMFVNNNSSKEDYHEQRRQDKSDSDLVSMLSECLIATEQGIQRINWDSVHISAQLRNKDRSVRERYNNHQGSGNHLVFKADNGYMSQYGEPEAKVLHKRCEDGTLVRADPSSPEFTSPPQVVRMPCRLADIDHEVVTSGAALLTGCRDTRGGSVILVFCRHRAWESEKFTSNELAKLLLYYQTVPSESIRELGMTIIVDMRGTTLKTLNVLLETLYTVESSQPQSIHIVHVLADKVAQSLLFKSSVFRPHVNLKIDLVTNIDLVYKFVDKSMLPQELGGFHRHNHNEWLHFRMKLDPFMEKCRHAAKFLVSIMHEMSLNQGMPTTSKESSGLIEQHEIYVKKALDEPDLVELRTHGEDTLAAIREEMLNKEFKEEYKESYESAKKLFSHVKESMFRLVKLADDRFHRLEQCLQLRQFEEKVTKLMNWLCTDGEDLLRKHSSLADNLKGIRTQQAQFEKSYFDAMTQIEKGNDLFEEASMLSQSDELEQVTGIKEISKELKGQMKGFSGRLEEVRVNIENTAQCYKMLDQCYEWALEAMKYVATMRMDGEMAVDDIEKLLTSLDLYLQEHPPINTQIFQEMERIATKVDNEKLQDQCKVAHSRCMETEQLLHVRQSTLKKAKEQLELEEQYEQERRDSLSHLYSDNQKLRSCPPPATSSHHHHHHLHHPHQNYFGPVVYRDHRGGSGSAAIQAASQPVWQQQQTSSSPVGPSMDYVLRRRSYAGKPSAPVYSPTALAFKESMQGVSYYDYEEHLFSEGLITEDMSDRIVTSLPKGLSDSTLKSSRESLRGSQENVTENDSGNSSVKDSSLDNSGSSHSKSMSKSIASRTSSLMITLNKHSKPHKKIMRRAASLMMPDSISSNSSNSHINTSNSSSSLQDSCDLKDRRNSGGRTLSMVTTQSTESLPCLPEEEGFDKSAQAERRQGWAPVPDGGHVREQRARNPFINQSMTDLRVAEDDIKRRRQLQLIMSEMVQTEQDYVEALRLIIDEYIPEIDREDVPQALRGKRNIIFGNLEKIYEFHSQYFLSELRLCMDNPYHICHCFLYHESEFFLYALYNKNKPRSDILMEEYGRNFFLAKQTRLGDKMDLSSYLLKPVQRMGKYSLLLKQIIKECPVSEPEYADLKAAYEMVKFQLRHGNDLLAMDCLTGADVNLQEQGMLLRQDTFLVFHGRRKALRHVFLFEEMIVFSKTKRTTLGKEVYTYKNSIKLSDLGLTENKGDSCYKFEIWFRKRTSNDIYTLQAPSIELKNEWIREISRLLWKQAIKNREMRLAESVRMGAGSKPCIDLKPSADNIQDRFVNISLAHRVPRIRNSIAVSNMDHMKNGNKRPHSLISVSSSTSSSSSSGMYGYVGAGSSANGGGGGVGGGVGAGAGALSITFESPYETSYQGSDGVVIKPMIPRSSTLCSNESGIVADIDSPVTSPVKEDAFTQTTLKRPVKKDSNKDDDTLSSASSSPHQSSKHSDSSHRLSLVELSMEDLDTVV